MLKSIPWILAAVVIAAIVYFDLGGVLNETIDVNNTAQLVRLGGAFGLALVLTGGVTALLFIKGIKSR